MSDFKPAIEKHAINEKKLQIHAQNATGKSATLKFNVNKNYPRIDVYTNDDNDPKQKEPIRAALDQPSFYLFLMMLEQAAKSKDVYEKAIDNKGHTFFGGKRSEKPEIISRLIVGKDDKGVVYITVSAKNRPKIKFPLLPTNWNDLVDAVTGQKASPGETSYLMALAWKEMLSQMVGTYLVMNFKEEEPKPQQQGGGNNRWQGNNNNNNQSQQRPAESMDESFGDNMPF